MSLTVVVGGQYGSEGKGKLVAHLACMARDSAVVRCGGTNSGHTVYFRGQPYPLRQLPSAAISPDATLFLGAGMVIDPALLQQELSDLEVDRSRVWIDRNAVVLDENDAEYERTLGLGDQVGSTLSGTGAATARKVLRDSRQRTAKDVPEFRDVVIDVSRRLNQLMDEGRPVLVEGTQGMGLSLHHSEHFPYATSRETSAAAFLSEVGLAPTLVTEVVVVVRTFPIRVAGNSGPLPGELTWAELSRHAGTTEELTETTTVTRRTRRVASFDWDQFDQAVRINRPTSLAVHGLDYLNFADRGVKHWGALSEQSRSFIGELESRSGIPVHFAFTGPRNDDLIDRRMLVLTEEPNYIAGVAT